MSALGEMRQLAGWPTVERAIASHPERLEIELAVMLMCAQARANGHIEALSQILGPTRAQTIQPDTPENITQLGSLRETNKQ